MEMLENEIEVLDICEEEGIDDFIMEDRRKAKLYVAKDGEWIEYGVGLVSLDTKVDASLPHGEVSRIIVTAFPQEQPEKLIMETPVLPRTPYRLSENSILWADAQLGTDIALSFLSREYCEEVFGQINAYQIRVNGVEPQDAGASGDTALATNNAEREWCVNVGNIPKILASLENYSSGIADFIHSQPNYWKELFTLFQQLRKEGDEATVVSIARIALKFMDPPYNSDRIILSQIVNGIDDFIEVIQFSLGRKDEESGFVSTLERQSSFRNPCGFDSAILDKIHILYACNYLRDLLPLNLEDAFEPCPLIALSEQFFGTLIRAICDPDEYGFTALCRALQENTAFEKSVSISNDLAKFLTELCKGIRSTTAELVKDTLVGDLFPVALPYFSSVLFRFYALSQCEEERIETMANGAISSSLVEAAGDAVQCVCDAITYCLSCAQPLVEGELTKEFREKGDQSTLALLMLCVGCASSTGVQNALYDVMTTLVTPFLILNDRIGRLWASDESFKKLAFQLTSIFNALASHPVDDAQCRWTSRSEIIAFHSLRTLMLVIRAVGSVESRSMRHLLEETQLMSALLQFIQVEDRFYMNLQASATLFMHDVILSLKSEESFLLIKSNGALEITIKTYLRQSRRHTLLTSSLASFIASVGSLGSRNMRREANCPSISSSFSASSLEFPPPLSMIQQSMHTEEFPELNEPRDVLVSDFVKNECRALVNNILETYRTPLMAASTSLYHLLESELQKTDENNRCSSFDDFMSSLSEGESMNAVNIVNENLQTEPPLKRLRSESPDFLSGETADQSGEGAAP